MNRLPIEVLNQIFILFHQQQKVEFMCVCREWRSIIEQYVLYDTIVIYSRDKFQKLIERLRNKPSRITQVQCLVLESDLGIDPALFSSLFYNVRIIYLDRKIHVNTDTLFCFPKNNRIEHIYESCRKSNSDDATTLSVYSTLYGTTTNTSTTHPLSSNNSENTDDEDDDSDNSQSSIQQHRRKYSYLKTKNISSHLLFSNTCPQLKSLAVSIYPISGKEFIRLLANAPNLTTLTLNEFTITFERLELLHSNLVFLKNLTILEGNVTLVDAPLPKNIQPAFSVSCVSFKIYRGRILMKTRFLQYIKLKYTRLESFSFHNIFNRENHINFYQDHGETQFFLHGLLPLLSHFNSGLKKLNLRLPFLDPTDMMILKKSSFKLEHLGLETSHSTDIIRECIPDLKPFSFLQSLCLYDPECENFEFLKQLLFLRKLQIHRPSPDQFKINALLDMCCDKLESLFLGDCWLISDIVSHRFYKLKEFILSKVILSKDLDTFISLFVPNLTMIKMNDCLFQDNDFCLPGHHLLNLIVTDHSFCISTNDYILVKTLNEGYKKVYATSQPSRRQAFFHYQGPAFHYPSKYQDKSYFLAFGPRVIFTFASVKDVYVSTPRSGNLVLKPLMSSF